MDIEALKSELQTDPNGTGYANMSPNQVASVLADKVISEFHPIPGKTLLKWAAAGATATMPARIVRINLAAQKLVPFDGVSFEAQGYAAAAVAAIQAQLPLSYDDPDIRNMITTLATAGILTATELAELDVLGTVLVSRAEQLGLWHVKPGHVEQARTV